MTQFGNQTEQMQQELKNLKQSLQHFKAARKKYDRATLEDLYFEKDQILAHYDSIIKLIEDEFEIMLSRITND